MGHPFITLAKRLMRMTPYELRRRMPAPTLPPSDLVLAYSLAARLPKTIVQVGACDGMMRDPIVQFVRKGAPRAILIEPNPLAFSRLQKTYAGVANVTLVQAAIGDEDGEATLYRAKATGKAETEFDRTLAFASFKRDHLVRHGFDPRTVEPITVPSRTLASLVAEFGLDRIDFLQIDAEGYDAAIVRQALQLAVLPGCINFEHLHLSTGDRRTLFAQLQEKGYLLGYDEWNVLALQKPVLESWQSEPHR